jgi:ankyrin repeat protein
MSYYTRAGKRFISAATEGDLETVRTFLDQDIIDIYIDEAFALAARNGHLEVVRLLLNNYVNVHAQDDYALSWAAENGHLEVVQLLLNNGANVHAGNDSALGWAAYNGHLEVVQLLFVNGADIHAGDDWALIFASRYGKLEVVRFLINNGANVHAQDDYALRYAAQYGHLRVVQLLLNNGANIHAGNDWALRWAAQFGHLEVVQLLLNNGANIHAQDDWALRYAAENGYLEVVQLLLSNGANVHADNDYALRLAARNEHLEVVNLLQNAILEQDFIRVIETIDVKHATQRYTYEQFSVDIHKLIEYNHPKLSDSVFVEYLITMYSLYDVSDQEKQQIQNSFKYIINNLGFVANESSLSILRRWYRLFPNEHDLFIDLKNRLEHEYEQHLMQYYKPGIGKGFFEQLQRDIEAGYVINEEMTLQKLLDLFSLQYMEQDLINKGVLRYMNSEGKMNISEFINFIISQL